MNALQLAELLVTARKSERVKVYDALRSTPSLFRPTLNAFVTHVSQGKIAEDYRVKTTGEWVGGTFPSRRSDLEALEQDFLGTTHRQVTVFFDAVRASMSAARASHSDEIRRLRFTPSAESTISGA